MSILKSKGYREGNNLTVAEISTVKPKHGEIVIVSVDISQLPISDTDLYMENIARSLQGTFPHNEVIVVPTAIKVQCVPY